MMQTEKDGAKGNVVKISSTLSDYPKKISRIWYFRATVAPGGIKGDRPVAPTMSTPFG
jgi:hypothetical protein